MDKNEHLPKCEEKSQLAPAKSKIRSRIGILLSFVVSGGLLFYVFSGIEQGDLVAALLQIQIMYLLPLIAVFICVMCIRAQRWRHLLPAEDKPSFVDAFDATMLGFLATYILPLRAGEIVRPLALARFSGLRFSVGFASIVNERVFDVLSLFVFLGLCLGQMSDIPDLVVTGSIALAAISGVILIVVTLSYLCPAIVKTFAKRVLSFLFETRMPQLFETLFGLAEGLVDGLRAVSSVKTLLVILAWSILLWFTMGIFYLIGLPVMGSPAAFWPGMMVNVIVALAVAAPSAPGFIGTFQFGCVIALTTMFGYPKEFSVAYSLVIHALQAVVIVTIGSVILIRRGIRFSELR